MHAVCVPTYIIYHVSVQIGIKHHMGIKLRVLVVFFGAF